MDNHPHDLMWGIAPRHVRHLCDNPWEGGGGYTPAQVGDMTLDEIIMLLVEKKNLREKGRQRVAKMKSLEVKIDKDGIAVGRASDGTLIRARVGGKSKAQLILERKAADRLRQETPKERRARERQERSQRRAKEQKGAQ